MQHPTSRRSFIAAGSLGFLGLSLRETLAGRGRHRFSPKRQSQGRHPFLAGRGSQPYRYMGSEVQQQLQADLHQRCGHPDLGTAAENGEAHGQVCPGALHAHPRHRPSAGHALRHHRPRDQSGHAVPQPGLDRHQGNGPPQRRAARTCWFPSGTAPGSTKSIFGLHFSAATTIPCASRIPLSRASKLPT